MPGVRAVDSYHAQKLLLMLSELIVQHKVLYETFNEITFIIIITLLLWWFFNSNYHIQ